MEIEENTNTSSDVSFLIKLSLDNVDIIKSVFNLPLKITVSAW